MASSILHIKDSYYFEVPKSLWPADYQSVADLPDLVIRLDQQFLDWEADRLYSRLGEVGLAFSSKAELMAEYHHWLHADHANSGKPLSAYLETTEAVLTRRQEASWEQRWQALTSASHRTAEVQAYRQSAPAWSTAKLDGYSRAMSGKILIPQPFGVARNLYEPAHGVCISRFMLVEVGVAILLGFVFIRLANRMKTAGMPTGRAWNALEAVLLFMRDEVARPAIGKKDADKFVPLLWTIFLFVLGCNLAGMVPWVGAPTGAFGVTAGLALVTLLTGIAMGSIKFGVLGYWKNQVPHMDLAWPMAILIKPMLWCIEVVGLAIKHAVLGIRLLANMVAGHVVLLGIMTLAFSLEGAISPSWWIAAPIAVVASTIFSLLELFVAFLQAYIFTFLSALFIGAAVHHH